MLMKPNKKDNKPCLYLKTNSNLLEFSNNTSSSCLVKSKKLTHNKILQMLLKKLQINNCQLSKLHSSSLVHN